MSAKDDAIIQIQNIITGCSVGYNTTPQKRKLAAQRIYDIVEEVTVQQFEKRIKALEDGKKHGGKK